MWSLQRVHVQPLIEKNKIMNTTQIEEFVSLWIRLQGVHLQPETANSISWKWAVDGQYSANAAYRAQFLVLGSYRHLNVNLIWHARTENKCKFFAWIHIQNKILTADKLATRGWPHEIACSLCSGPLETGQHLCLLCPSTQAVCTKILNLENLIGLQ